MAVTLVEDGTGVDIAFGPATLGRYIAAPDADVFESPRPYLHPLRTVGGVDLTDVRPADHLWHHGLSLAIPSVGASSGESNLWGGRSWDRAAGEYLDKGDNGAMRTDDLAVDAPGGRIDARVSWLGADGTVLADEDRSIAVAEAHAGWTLDWTSRIRPRTSLRLGSPATYGRVGAGYGGLFLRAAPGFQGARARTDRSGIVPADELLGARARWLAVTRADGAATIVLGTPSDSTWFVRSEEYPGFGPAPFFPREVAVEPGEQLELGVRLWAVDGEPGRAEIERVFASA